MAIFILPNGKPGLQEAAGEAESVSNRTDQQIRQYPLLFVRQVLWAMEKQGTV